MTAGSFRQAGRRRADHLPASRVIGKIEEKAVKTHLICAIALGLAGTATAASAQDSDTFLVQTNVSAFCTNLSAAPGPLDLEELAGADGFVVTTFAGATSFSIPGYYCNAPATITLKAEPLVQTDGTPITDPAAFTNLVNYTANLTWDDVSGSSDSTVVDGTPITTAEANAGNLMVWVSDPNTVNNRRPIAGVYAGAVTLTITLN